MSAAIGCTTVKNIRRGFTLVELMIVVAIVGVLAVIALVGYQKYSRSAAAGEARAMLLSIRGAEDAYRSEMLVYKDCGDTGTSSNYYPRDYTASDGKKVGWGDTGTAVGLCFQQLNVKSNGPVRFNFAVTAGAAGAAAFTAGAPPNTPAWPFTGVASADPWYVTAAVGKSSAGSPQYSVLYTSSGQSEVTVVDDTQ